MSAISELHKAIEVAWNGSSLNSTFNAYWTSANRASYFVLNDTKAVAAQPFPYCNYTISNSRVVSRMTKSQSTGRMEQHEVDLEFRVFARAFSSNPTISAKQLASTLADSVMAVFGGHTTISPTALELATGTVIRVRFENDFGVNEGDQEYSWHVKYMVLIDFPLAV